jgi:ppGpp synthetase/RelA/SpoT-type nucleotidyltranferase
MNDPKYSYQSLLRTLVETNTAMGTERIEKTLKLAFEGHRGQFRESRSQSASIPFIVHPVGTAILVSRYYPLIKPELELDLESVVCVALAHDLIEDTLVDANQIEAMTGFPVRSIVESLTKPPAEIAGKNKESRNEDFAQQIIRGGRTAVFVKICDSIHNMSRPNATPTKLFRKTVDKARTWYRPMLDRIDLGVDFKEAYDAVIHKAERLAQEEEKFAKEQLAPKDIGAAISECVASSRGKVLELHDILTLLHRFSCSENTSIWSASGKNKNLLTLVYSSDPEMFSQQSFEFAECDTPELIQADRLRGFPLAEYYNQGCCVYMVPMQIGHGRSFVVSLAIRTSHASPWLTIEATTMAVQFLAHRLVVSELERKARVMSEAARLGVQLDDELAVQSGISPSELKQLEGWRVNCRQAVSCVESILQHRFLSVDSHKRYAHSLRLESRVKSVNSILRKCQERSGPSLSRLQEIEDIAGVRILCPTIEFIDQVFRFLVSLKMETSGCRLHPTIEKPIRNWLKEPTVDGYRALHVLLEINISAFDDGLHLVPCEVQLRTPFQDVWAKIAHQTVYDRTRVDRNLAEKVKKLSQDLEKCELLAEEIWNQSLNTGH